MEFYEIFGKTLSYYLNIDRVNSDIHDHSNYYFQFKVCLE